MSSTFQRTKENFTCEYCGAEIVGTGYTNHCHICLWSKHVDIHPGDRANACGGLMEPIEVISRQGTYILRHKCVICGYEKSNKVEDLDDPDAILAIARK